MASTTDTDVAVSRRHMNLPLLPVGPGIFAMASGDTYLPLRHCLQSGRCRLLRLANRTAQAVARFQAVFTGAAGREGLSDSYTSPSSPAAQAHRPLPSSALFDFLIHSRQSADADIGCDLLPAFMGLP